MKDRKDQKRKPRQDIVVEVDVRKLVRFSVLLLMAVLLLFCAFFVGRRFLTVKSYTVSGVSEYDVQEIVQASGVRRGARLYLLDRKKIEEKLLEECPYLSSVKVRPKFPNRLHFEVEGNVGHWYIDVAGTRYVLDGDLNVIDDRVDTEGMARLILPNLKSVLVGELPAFGDSETEVKKTLELVAALRESELAARLTMADLSDRTDIVIEVDGAYTVRLGDSSKFASKLREVSVLLEEETVKKAGGGEINASVPGAMAFKPKKTTADEGDKTT